MKTITTKQEYDTMTTQHHQRCMTALLIIAITALLSGASGAEEQVRIDKDVDGKYGFRVVRTVSANQARKNAPFSLPPVPTNLVSFPPTPVDLPTVQVDRLHER